MEKLHIPSWPQWGGEEKENLRRAVENAQWGTLGKEALAFAEEFAAYCGVPYAIAVNNGTQALELLLRGAGVGYGDEVIAPDYTFIATASAIALTGAKPVLADVDPETGCIDVSDVRRRITSRTKAIVVMHMGGRPCDMDALGALAQEAGIPLLEDAAHAPGCGWRGRKVGSLGLGASFSFQRSKTLTSGEGGAIVTKDRALFERCWHYHNSGRPVSGAKELGGRVLMGTNGRMAEWEASILRAQLKRLDSQNAARAEGARRLDGWLSQIPGALFKRDERITQNGGFLYCFRAPRERRSALIEHLNALGVPAVMGYKPLHTMGMFRSPGYIRATGDQAFDPGLPHPGTEALGDTAVWLPSYVLLAKYDTLDAIGREIVGMIG